MRFQCFNASNFVVFGTANISFYVDGKKGAKGVLCGWKADMHIHTQAALEGLTILSARGAQVSETVGRGRQHELRSYQQYFMRALLTPPNAVNDNVTYTWTWEKGEVIVTVCMSACPCILMVYSLLALRSV